MTDYPNYESNHYEEFPEPGYEEYEYYFEREVDIYSKISRVILDTNVVFELLTVFANIFHLIVLFQKELRSSSVFILMIGICLADIFGFLCLVYEHGIERVWFAYFFLFLRSFLSSNSDFLEYRHSMCLSSDYYIIDIQTEVRAVLMRSARPISTWLAILMALIRTLSVIFPMSNRVQRLTKGSSAILIVCIVSLFWVVYYSWYFIYMEFIWFPDHVNDFCSSPSTVPNITLLVFPFSRSESRVEEKFLFLHRLIPTIVYPILTTFLFLELRRIKKKRVQMNRNSDGEKSDSTTKLILFMTVSFMFSEGLAGVMQFVADYVFPMIEIDYEDSMDLIYILSLFHNAVMVLRTWNALSHFFVCYMMSSQYRDTVKRMFCCCKPKLNVIMVRGSEPNSDNNT